MKRFTAEVFAFSGVAAVIYGIQQWSQPAAWIIGGVAAMFVGVTLYRKGTAG